MSKDSVTSFSSDLSHLQSVATPTPRPSFAGAWSTIEFQPDIFSPQRFIVGIAVQIPGDRIFFKLISGLKKFECIYHEKLSHQAIKEVLAYAEEVLRRGAQAKKSIPEIVFDTSSLFLSPPQYTSGDSCEATVERLFNELVVMEIAQKPEGTGFESIDTPHARRLVNEELKRIANLDFERIVNPSTQGILLEDKGEKHFLDFNLLTTGACGSVTSAAYKVPQTVELSLLKSSRDLTTFSRIRKLESVGLFLLMPDASFFDPKEYKRIENVIDEYEWKLERDGFRVVSLASPTELATEIYEWAKPTL